LQVPSVQQQQARIKWKPEEVRLLLLTEAPPPPESDRYFYYTDVRKGDSLFLETVKVLFPEEVEAFSSIKELRANKAYFLERLSENGVYVVSAFPSNLKNQTDAKRSKHYLEYFPNLIGDLLQIISPKIPLAIVSTVVYKSIGQKLQGTGFNLIHDQPIPFPNSGQQKRFRTNFSRVLREIGFSIIE
jgi:hypothetical protein